MLKNVVTKFAENQHVKLKVTEADFKKSFLEEKTSFCFTSPTFA